MILKTKDFQTVAKTILIAVNDEAANLELLVKGNKLGLSVATQEYHVTKVFDLENPEEFRAVIPASIFLSNIADIDSETFELKISGNTVVVKSGKSQYKFPMVFENDQLLNLPKIQLDNKLVEMVISNEILDSIVNVNSKELSKVKNLDVNEIQRLYYVDETGCFTFTTGATLNSFSLEKPVKLLLTDKIVKLFKLFNEPVLFNYGTDSFGTMTQNKIVLETSSTRVAAIINNDDELISKIQGPCADTKRFANEQYANHLVVLVKDLTAAVSRLLAFSKYATSDTRLIPAKFTLKQTELDIIDSFGNTEVIQINSNSYIDTEYVMLLNLLDLKAVLDTCKLESITINCGNHAHVSICRGNITNLIAEGDPSLI